MFLFATSPMDTMPVLTDEEVFPVPLGVMQPGTLAPVNLYIRVHALVKYVLYKASQTELREDTRQRLIDHGVQTLYLCKKDEQVYREYVEANLSAIIRDDLVPAESACQLVYETSARVMSDVFQDTRSGKNMQRAHGVVQATVLSILKNPDALWHMTAMAAHDYYTYTHCVHVCMFLISSSRDILGITDARLLESIGMGGIFHDIGKSRIPQAILNKPGKLTPEEFELIKQHPAMGVNVVRKDRHVDALSVEIIRAHHEHFDGKGYPRGLAGEGIDRLSRLATIVDVYDALTTRRAYAPARAPYSALELMLKEMTAHFDLQMLKAFVKFLGPKESRMELRARWDKEAARALQEGAAQ